jgi:hypothetical protein
MDLFLVKINLGKMHVSNAKVEHGMLLIEPVSQNLYAQQERYMGKVLLEMDVIMRGIV